MEQLEIMNVYPYSSPIILNDQVFVQNGGQTGTFTSAQRQAAYVIAEQQMTSHIGTFLLPTIVTGTFPYQQRITTDYGYVHQVYSVSILSQDLRSTACNLHSSSACVNIWSDTFAYLDLGCISLACDCYVSVPYQIQVAYQAGLPTGVASQPAMLLALTMAAQISLNEMAYPSQNEGTGDIGIEEFSSLGYREKRVKLVRNAFGSSAKANKIGQLVNSTIKLARPATVL